MKRASDFSQVVIGGSRRDADRISHALSQQYVPLMLEPLDGTQRFRMNLVQSALPGVRLSWTNLAGGMRVLPQTVYDAVGFILPVSGRVESQEGRRTFAAVPDGALAVNGPACSELRYSLNLHKYGLAIDRPMLARRLSTLLDRPAPQDLLFASQADARSINVPALAALLECVTGEAFGHAARRSAFMASRIPDLLMDFVLEMWPHNHSQAFRRKPPLIAPRHVKLAIDFIEANPHVPASAEDLARLCDVSLRALQYGFRRFVGASITEHQRLVRLQRARADLLRGADSIEAVALRWGFSNAGRFSQYFRAAFGILPSELRRP